MLLPSRVSLNRQGYDGRENEESVIKMDRTCIGGILQPLKNHLI